MAIRLFKCTCGHKMRLSGAYCNRCGTEKPFLKSLAPLRVVLFGLFLSASAVIAIYAVSSG